MTTETAIFGAAGVAVVALVVGLSIGHAVHNGELTKARQDLVELRIAFVDGKQKYSDGYVQGMNHADAAGAYNRGKSTGFDDGYKAGRVNAENSGEAHISWYQEGYKAGKNDQIALESPQNLSDSPYTHLMTGAHMNVKLDPGGCIVGPFEMTDNAGSSMIVHAGARWPDKCDTPKTPTPANIWCDAANTIHVDGDLPHVGNLVRVKIDCVPPAAVLGTITSGTGLTTVYPQGSLSGSLVPLIPILPVK